MAKDATRAQRRPRGPQNVVNLGAVREARRVRELERRCSLADALNRKSLADLFGSGLLYTRQGARLGRELLLAHQLTFRVWEILATLRPDDAPSPGAAPGDEEAEKLAREAGVLLAKIAALTARSEVVLARRR